MKIEQVFIIVDRNIDNVIKVQYSKDLVEAICMQKALLVGASPEMIKGLLKQEEINAVATNLKTAGRDRLANDEEEVYIFLLPSIEKFR